MNMIAHVSHKITTLNSSKTDIEGFKKINIGPY